MTRHPSRPTNDVTELAKERTRQAAERTLTAWINISLVLIGFGILLKEIPAALARSLPQISQSVHLWLSYFVGLGTIACGIILLIPVAIAHQQSIQALAQDNYLKQPMNSLTLTLLVGAILLLGVVALVNVILVVSQ